MSERSAALGNSAPQPAFEFEGKTYTFSLITHGVMTGMEKKLFAKAAEPLAALRDQMDTEAYQKRLDALLEREEKGEFAFESPAMEKHLESMNGAAQIIALLMGASEDEVLRMLQLDSAQMNLLFKQAMAQSFPKRTGTAPKAKARSRR